MTYFNAWLVVNDTDQPLFSDNGQLSIFETKIEAEKYIEDYKEFIKKNKKYEKRGRRIIKIKIEF